MRNLKTRLLAVVALASCIGCSAPRTAGSADQKPVPAAGNGTTEYFIVAQPGDNARATTYGFDSGFSERLVSRDTFAVARNSAHRLRFRFDKGKVYTVDGKLKLAPCAASERHYAFTPSGAYYACAGGEYPHTVFRVFRTRDRRQVATIPSPTALLEGGNAMALLDEDRLAFTSVDDGCSDPHLSVDVISLGRHFARKPLQRCVSGVAVGTKQVAYLRGKRDEIYSLDGNNWTAQTLYGFDAEDRPITDDSPLIRKFGALHPGAAVMWVTVGHAPAIGTK